MPFVEVATSVRGLVQFLVGLAKANVVDAEADSDLRAELHRRCAARELLKYRRDEGQDRWTCFSLFVERTSKDDPIRGDCEDLSAIWAAHLILRGFRVALCITQPREGATAHAYLRVLEAESGAWRVWDPSVWAGMRDPGPEFYARGETHCCELEMPC